MNDATYEPKQARSRQTLERLVDSLWVLLEQKYFEKVTINEIVAGAGVSPGSFYRRFKNKEALLPLLYQRFEEDLRQWLDTNEKSWRAMALPELVRSLCRGVLSFYLERSGLIRTIHLNARMRADVLNLDQMRGRLQDYQRMAGLLLLHRHRYRHPKPAVAAEMAVFSIVSLAMEKAVYADLTPAMATSATPDEAMEEVAAMITQYLTGLPPASG